ncbi:amidase family protein [Hypoxylon fragiforme]|uniref:amidase family protein n=1 Tax=Hypoxylon fragiforme TaxID=63214 RepID=UPI0020C5E090|nr:amidase family protein [Hypoxylon fragiforme]KAI2610665.1 amidase family protein [Hypoxylon fragiforme]
MGFLNLSARSAAAAVLLLLLCASWPSALASPVKQRAPLKPQQTTQNGDVAFGLGEQSYFANLQHPKITLSGTFSAAASQQRSPSVLPFTVIFAEDEVVTGEYLQDAIARYVAGDDVFSEDFLEGLYIAHNGTSSSSSSSRPSLDASALEYLTSTIKPRYLFLDSSFNESYSMGDNIPITYVSPPDRATLVPGPFAASISSTSATLGIVYRLYRDTHRNFLYGTYLSAGTFRPLELTHSRSWAPLIPVPSRIYSWGDARPLAGFRVAIKDLFDMKGLVTSGGSLAWAEITEAANATAPAVQRILDLGGVLVGKYKLAQFASGANPWEWQDEQYPFNARGDGWLTCSASSSGGGCSVAAYDWLDFAVGSDTGSSMRRPAAVSGTYGNRPSQGMMDLSGVMPLGAATDTAGVFARDVRGWVRFAKHWYVPAMQQDPAITGLSPLAAPDSHAFPKRILYLTDYLPLRNPAAEAILQAFLKNMTTVFGMTLENFNMTAFVANAPADVPKYDALSNATGVINTMTQWQEVGRPLITAWNARYDGRFPPIDAARRPWRLYNESVFTPALYNRSMAAKRAAVDWFESSVLFSTPESCSESIMVWDIGTGGLPSYREADMMTGHPDTTAFLAVTPPGAGINGASLCPIYGCVDMTIPIGQVPYLSNITLVEEMVPVTVSVIARRGCDFMLWNMWERLADEGVLRAVKTGRTPF